MFRTAEEEEEETGVCPLPSQGESSLPSIGGRNTNMQTSDGGLPSLRSGETENLSSRRTVSDGCTTLQRGQANIPANK